MREEWSGNQENRILCPLCPSLPGTRGMNRGLCFLISKMRGLEDLCGFFSLSYVLSLFLFLFCSISKQSNGDILYSYSVVYNPSGGFVFTGGSPLKGKECDPSLQCPQGRAAVGHSPSGPSASFTRLPHRRLPDLKLRRTGC